MFQKKVKEPEAIVMSEKDIKKLKEKIESKDDNLRNLKIRDLKMEEIIPQSFNGVIISIFEGYHTLFLPEGMDKHKYRTFQRSAGGQFNKDVLDFSRGKKHGKYILIEGDDERKIVRIIEDEEISQFNHLKLIKGIIKDRPYMLFKKLQENEKLISTERYSNQHVELEEIEEIIESKPMINAIDDDFDSPVSSISLFDE